MLGLAVRLRALPRPQRREQLAARQRPVLLPAEAGVATARRGCGTGVFVARRGRCSACRAGTIRATVLIETILAAVRDGGDPLRAAGARAGAQRRPLGLHLLVIKKLRHRAEFVLPDRAQVTMARAVHARLHRAARRDLSPARRARDRRHGGVHPLAPRPRGQRASRSRRCARTRSARSREGFDGTWVAHPDLVPGRARGVRRACSASGRTSSSGCARTSCPTRRLCSTSPNAGRGHRRGPARRTSRWRSSYIDAWLARQRRGRDLQPDGGRSDREIARSQIWQWLHHGKVSPDQVRRVADEEQAKLGPGYEAARELLDEVAVGREFVEFLTLPAYARLA